MKTLEQLVKEDKEHHIGRRGEGQKERTAWWLALTDEARMLLVDEMHRQESKERYRREKRLLRKMQNGDY